MKLYDGLAAEYVQEIFDNLTHNFKENKRKRNPIRTHGTALSVDV